MSRDYEPIAAEGTNGVKLRSIVIMLLVAFVGGAIATGWIVTRYDIGSEPAAETAVVETKSPAEQRLADSIDSQGRAAAVSAMPLAVDEQAATVPADLERALSRRVGDLEDRLSRINVQAQAASGNAARAEGLLIAFAARRALDTGSPLGYIRGQLQLRFGSAQPVAVDTILEAAREPVTLEELQSQLDEVGDRMTVGGRDRAFWPALKKEVGELFILRREGTPSPAPSQRLRRARRFTEAGNIAAAIAEVERLPNRDVSTEWLAKARRYANARDALDIIENAAILEPRQLRDAEGESVQQPSPLSARPATPN